MIFFSILAGLVRPNVVEHHEEEYCAGCQRQAQSYCVAADEPRRFLVVFVEAFSGISVLVTYTFDLTDDGAMIPAQLPNVSCMPVALCAVPMAWVCVGQSAFTQLDVERFKFVTWLGVFTGQSPEQAPKLNSRVGKVLTTGRKLGKGVPTAMYKPVPLVSSRTLMVSRARHYRQRQGSQSSAQLMKHPP